MIADAARKGETACKTSLVQVIEEQAAYAARLATVTQVEVVVTPLFITAVDVIAEFPAGRMGDAVPVAGILLETIWVSCKTETD